MKLQDDTILVTGAGGYIGGWVVEAAALATSARIRGGVRKWSSAARISRFPIDVVLCDIMKNQEVQAASEGATVLVHCASGDPDVVVQGTENMLHAALRRGMKRFIYLSSAEVYGSPSGDIDESAPRPITDSEYGNSKIEAENLCWQYSERGLPVSILRPTLVYGPFGKTWTMTMANRLQSGKWGTIRGYGEGTCNLVFVSDLVRAIFASIENENAVGQAFNINGMERITWNQYFRRFNQRLELPELRDNSAFRTRLRSLAAGPIKGVASSVLREWRSLVSNLSRRYDIAGTAMKGAEGTLKATPSTKELNLYSRKAFYLSTKAENMIGHRPEYDLARGIDLSVQWLKHHGVT